MGFDINLSRGKGKNGMWIEGAYFKHCKEMACFSGEGQPDAHLIIFDGSCDWGFEPPIKCIEVIPETVGRCTGIADMNSKYIFCGDIVKENCSGLIGVVEFDEATATFRLKGKDGFFGDNCRIENASMEWVIIGNIHDNPELLK